MSSLPESAFAPDRGLRALNDHDRRIAAESIDEEPAVTAWLTGRPVAGTEHIVVSWADDIAVQTRWSVFAAFWSDFCYPGPDDVTIWCLADPHWTLLYHHEEAFYFKGTIPLVP